MKFLNQLSDSRRHDEQVSDWLGVWVPKRVRSSSWRHDKGAGSGLDNVVTALNAKSALKDVPSFVVGVVNVKRGH